jgi:hypothetical protein
MKEIKDSNYFPELVLEANTVPNGNTWISMCYSPNLKRFCAISSANGAQSTMYSNDGITWNYASCSYSGNERIIRVDELNKFIAVGSGLWPYRTSTNGTSWSGDNMGGQTSQFGMHDICWAPELHKLCAIARDDTGQIRTSIDGGVSVNKILIPGGDNYSRICWSPELTKFLLIRVSSWSTYISMSSDGETWEMDVASIYIGSNNVRWIPELNKFCLTGNITDKGKIATSSNGITWNTWSSLSAS